MNAGIAWAIARNENLDIDSFSGPIRATASAAPPVLPRIDAGPAGAGRRLSRARGALGAVAERDDRKQNR